MTYPNYLATSEPDRPHLRPAPCLAAVLLLACLVPRILMANKIDVICVDGALYVRLAQCLERGILSPPDSMGMELNFLSVILAQLHGLGLSWELAPKVLGVSLSTLAVLPMFGWVRRQFDDRVAVVACLLYALHPDLIEWSPEAMREPTFWFFFTTALYLMWRAAVEVRWGFFAASGATIAMAALTRVEGLFLFIPLVWWSVVRWRALAVGRARLLVGTVLVAASFPAALVAVNLAWVGNDTSWGLLRTAPLQRVQWWVESWVSGESADEVVTTAPSEPAVTAGSATTSPAALAAATVAPRMPLAQAVWRYVDRMGRGLWPPFALLMFGGYFAWRAVFDRRDHLPLAVVGLLIAAGAWIHLWNTQDLSSRYVLTIVVMSCRCAALGWIGLCGWALRLADRMQLRRPLLTVLPAATLVLLSLTGWIDALSGSFDNRVALASLGRWIRAEYGDSCTIIGSERQLPLVGFYAQGSADTAPRGLNGEPFARWVEGMHPDLVIISQRQQTPDDYAALLAQRDRLGLEIVSQDRIPVALRKMIVLARRAPKVAKTETNRGIARAEGESVTSGTTR